MLATDNQVHSHHPILQCRYVGDIGYRWVRCKQPSPSSVRPCLFSFVRLRAQCHILVGPNSIPRHHITTAVLCPLADSQFRNALPQGASHGSGQLVARMASVIGDARDRMLRLGVPNVDLQAWLSLLILPWSNQPASTHQPALGTLECNA
jgi:hypothetical protein